MPRGKATTTSFKDWHMGKIVNSLPNDKILDWSKLKAFADDNIKVLNIIIFVFDRIENIVRKVEKAGYQHFLPFA